METEESGDMHSRHIEGNEELEVGAGIFGSLVRVGDLVRLPIVGSDIEGEGIDAVVVGKVDVIQPGILGVGVGVSHHVVGGDDLIVAGPLGNYGNEIAERLGKLKIKGAAPIRTLT